MRYSVSESGIRALRAVAGSVTASVEEIYREVSSLLDVQEEHQAALGPHSSTLREALTDICGHLRDAAEPAVDISERLRRVADLYQEILDDDSIANVGDTSGAGVAAVSGAVPKNQILTSPGGTGHEDADTAPTLSPEEKRRNGEQYIDRILDVYKDSLLDRGVVSAAGLAAAMAALRKHYQTELEKEASGQPNGLYQDPDYGRLVEQINSCRSPIAGITPGERMSFADADSGHVNPNYGKEYGYSVNCQSCVVVFEARQRGYDAQVLPCVRGSMLEKLSTDPSLAWIDPKTGKHPEYICDETRRTPDAYLDFVCDTVKPGERYTIQFIWKGRGNCGHIVNLDRTPAGLLRIKDNQRGPGEKSEWIGDFAVLDYLSRMRYEEKPLFGKATPCVPQLLRIDNVDFDYGVVSHIMKGV